jgi:hypothetical protein
MNRIRSFLAVGFVGVVIAGAAATAACSDSDSDSNSNVKEDEGREKAHVYYVQRVHPAISSCVGCHSVAGTPAAYIMRTEAEASYAALEKAVGLVAAPKTSPLLVYQHKDTTIRHTPDQRAIITQWLGFEATARNLEGAIPQARTVTDAYKAFADCMNFDVWTFYRMGDLAFSQTDMDGPCMGCHSSGQGSAWLSAASRETFEKMKQFPYIQKLIVGKLDITGSFEDMTPSKRFAVKSEEICPPESTSCHPRFGLAPEIRDSIDGFVATTIQNLATGTCSSGIVVPIDAGTPDAGEGGVR